MNLRYEDKLNDIKIYQGDCLETLKQIPDGTVNCCVTSPPYFNLRDYHVEGQIGQEKTPQEYINKLSDLFEEVRRVLTDDGTLWLNLGDSYARQGGPCPEQSMRRKQGDKADFVHRGQAGGKSQKLPPGIKSKDLIGIPWSVAFALRNNGWYLRSEIIWEKPDCMPESVRDRPTRAHENIFLLSKSEKYFYDFDAVLEPYTEPLQRWGGDRMVPKTKSTWNEATGQEAYRDRDVRPNPNGKNKRSVWKVSAKPFEGAHFATFPIKLIEPCILAGCPKGGVVLDPFLGSGTTLLVAMNLGRKGIGIELNDDYVKIAIDRIDVGLLGE